MQMDRELHWGDEVKKLCSRLIAEGNLVERGTANSFQNQKQSDSWSLSLLVNKNTVPWKKKSRRRAFPWTICQLPSYEMWILLYIINQFYGSKEKNPPLFFISGEIYKTLNS